MRTRIQIKLTQEDLNYILAGGIHSETFVITGGESFDLSIIKEQNN